MSSVLERSCLPVRPSIKSCHSCWAYFRSNHCHWQNRSIPEPWKRDGVVQLYSSFRRRWKANWPKCLCPPLFYLKAIKTISVFSCGIIMLNILSSEFKFIARMIGKRWRHVAPFVSEFWSIFAIFLVGWSASTMRGVDLVWIRELLLTQSEPEFVLRI